MRRIRINLLCLAAVLAVCMVFTFAEAAGAPKAPGRPARVQATATPEPEETPLLAQAAQNAPGRNALIVVYCGPCDADPDGRRFEAARLAFENLASNAENAPKGQLGAIVFGGDHGCVSIGPMALAEGYDALATGIGAHLSSAALQNEPSDMGPALRAAQRMLRRFGPNDETDLFLFIAEGEAWSLEPEPGTEAAEDIEDLIASGARFFPISLSESAESLNARTLEALIRAESDIDDTGRVTGSTPVKETFQVPYTGIAGADVNLMFAPGSKDLLQQVSLTDPDGNTYALWDGAGPRPVEGIRVVEGDSYVLLTVPDPKVGEWTVSVAGQAVPVDTVVRLDQGLRLNVSMNSFIDIGSDEQVTVWFQAPDGWDLDGSEIYTRSTATLQLFAPGESEPTQTLEMTLNGARYTAEFTPDRLGIWTGRVVVENPWLRKTVSSVAFEVITPPTPTPTPRPTPTPSPVPALVPIEGIAVSISPTLSDAEGALYLDARADAATFSWEIDGEAEAVSAELLEDGEVLRSNLHSGVTMDRTLFKEGSEYTLRVTAMPKNGKVNSAEPVVEEVSFALAPEVVPVEALTLSVEPTVPDSDEMLYIDRDADSFTVSWTLDGQADAVEGTVIDQTTKVPLREHLSSGDTLERGLFEDGVVYALQVSAIPKNGTLTGEPAMEEILEFALYPQASPITGLRLDVPDGSLDGDVFQLGGSQGTLVWYMDEGEADYYQLLITDPQNAIAVQQTLPGSTVSYPLNLDQRGDYRVTLIATPRYAANAAMNVTASLTARPKLPGFLQKYWYFLVGGAALLAGLVALVIVIRNKTAKKVSGAVRIACYEPDAAINTLLVFSSEGRGVKLNAPLTAHPVIAKYKGKKLYTLLSNVRVNMATADSTGKAPGETGEVQHRANSPLISFTLARKKGEKGETVYVGRYDLGTSVLNIVDGGKTYEVLFCDSRPSLWPKPS